MSLLAYSIYIAIVGVLLQFTIYLYLYIADKKRYLGIWALSWGFSLVRHFFEIINNHYNSSAIFISFQLASLFSGLLLLWGTYIFLKKKIPAWWVIIGALDSFWIVIGVMLNLSFPLMTFLTFMFQGMVYFWTGVVLLYSKQVSGAGKYITGWGFILWGLHKGNYPFIKPIEWLAPWGYLLAFVFGFTVAVGTMLVYFVKVRNELRESEEQLRESEERYRQVVDLSPDAIYIQCEGKFVFANPATAKMLGFEKPEQLYGKYILDFIHPDSVETAKSGINSTRQDITIPFVEGKFLRRDGAPLEVEVVATPFKYGKKPAALVLVREITERKRAEELVRKLSYAVEQSPSMVMITDSAGYIEYINPRFSKIRGYSYQELIGQHTRILSAEAEKGNGFHEFIQRINSGEEWHGEILVNKKDGNQYWEYTAVSPIKNQNGETTHYLKVAEDITELKRKEQELQKAIKEAEAGNKAKSQFLANISHELRTPMNGIIGMTDLLLTTEITAEQKEYLELTKSSAESLLNLISDLLDISAVEVGKLRLELAPFNLNEIIKKIMKIYGLRAQKKGLELKFAIHPCVPADLNGDPGRLRQILENLIGNAIKFTEKGSISLRIELYKETETSVEIIFAVSDTGIGIPTDKKEVLFKNFSQIDNLNTRKYGGTGLGLAICKQLVEMMGGRIWVNSETGVGSVFSFIVSFGKSGCSSVKQNRQSSLELSEILKRDGFAKVSILLVEDHPINQKVVSRLLQRMGWEVTIASNGFKALEVLNGNRFDLILMDIQMPEMDGIELTLKIREQEKPTKMRTPIIALTAYTLEQEKANCEAAGMNGYISKPISAEMLYMKLIEVLRQKKSRTHLIDQSPPLDLETTLRIVEGDRELAREILLDLKDDIPGRFAELGIAIVNNDFAKLKRLAHNFRGALSYFGAKEAIQLTKELEDISVSHPEQASMIVRKLETEMARMNQFITDMERRNSL